MTPQQALDALQAGMTQRLIDIQSGRAPSFGLDQVKGLAAQLSVNLTGVDAFAFYSGSYFDQVASARDAALSLASQSSRVGIIDNTDLGRFLNAPDLRSAVTTIAGSAEAASSALFGTGLSNAEVGNSLWGSASLRFADTVSGNVIVFALPGTLNPDGIWSQIEFEAVLRNSNVQTLNGISTSQLLAQIDNPNISYSVDDARRGIEARHADHLALGDVRVDNRLNGAIEYGDDFLARNGVDGNGFGGNPNVVTSVDPSSRSWFQLPFDPDYVRAGTALAALGYVGDALSAYVTYAQASELASQGDYLGATRSWFGWAANTGGSLGGGVIGGLAFSVFGPGGTVGGALVGGYAGGQAAEDIANFAFDNGIAPTARYIYDLLPASQAPPASQLSLMDIEGGVAWVDQSGFAWQTATGDATGFGELTFYRPGGGVHGVETLQPDGTRSTTLFDAFGREVAQRTETASSGEQTIRVTDPTEEHAWSFNEATLVDGGIVATRTRLDSGATVSRIRDPRSDPDAAGSWTTTVNYNSGPLLGGEIGSIFGSALGQSLGGSNPFARIAASSVLGTLLDNVGETFGDVVANGTTLVDAANSAFHNFSAELGGQIRSAGIGAISAFLTAELAEEIGVDTNDFGGALFSYASNTAIGGVANTLLEAALRNATVGQALFDNFGGTLFQGAAAGFSTANIAGFVGRYLASQIVEPQNLGGSIGSSIGSLFGTAIGAGLTGAGGVLGSIGSGVLSSVGLQGVLAGAGALSGIFTFGISTLIFALIGTVIGNSIGGYFSNNGHSERYVTINPGQQNFALGYQSNNETWYVQSITNLAQANTAILNSFIGSIGGRVINGEAVHVRHITRRSSGDLSERVTVAVDKVSGRVTTADRLQRSLITEDRISFGTIGALKELKVAGGNLYVKRAIANSGATTLAQLAGEIKIAEDYGRYLAQKDVVDELIRQNPDSAFAAGWLITLLQAEQLGLTQLNKTDFYGGVGEFLKSFELERFGATIRDVVVSRRDGALVLSFTPPGRTEAREVVVGDLEARTGLKFLADPVTGTAVGTQGHDLWFGRNGETNAFTDSNAPLDLFNHDVLIGGNLADVIQAGTGNDFVQGNAGNDTIDGGTGDDVIAGGTGTDSITGGKGNDTYVYQRGDGHDTIAEVQTEPGGVRTQAYTTRVQTGTIQSIDYYGLEWDYGFYLLNQNDVPRELWVDPANPPLAYLDERGYYVVEGQGAYTLDIAPRWYYLPVATPVFSDQIAYRSTTINATTVQSNGNSDQIRFGAGIGKEDVLYRFEGNDLVLGVVPADYVSVNNQPPAFTALTDTIRLINWKIETTRVESFAFADGSVLKALDILFAVDPVGTTALNFAGQPIVRVNGGVGHDTLYSGANASIVRGGDGNDTFYASTGADIFDGGAGIDYYNGHSAALTGGVVASLVSGYATKSDGSVDRLINVENLRGGNYDDAFTGDDADNAFFGSSGNDTLIGGRGNDTLSGGTGSDTYVFNAGDGADTIQNGDSESTSSIDKLTLGGGINAESLLLSRSGNDLLLTSIGSTDRVTIENWYGSSAASLDEIRSADGRVLRGAGVDQLVNAMASFSPNNVASTTWGTTGRPPDAVQVAINGAWTLS